jgi:hypothetical protein
MSIATTDFSTHHYDEPGTLETTLILKEFASGRPDRRGDHRCHRALRSTWRSSSTPSQRRQSTRSCLQPVDSERWNQMSSIVRNRVRPNGKKKENRRLGPSLHRLRQPRPPARPPHGQPGPERRLPSSDRAQGREIFMHLGGRLITMRSPFAKAG